MFWVMTRLFPFQQLHLAPSELSPLAQGRFHSSIRSRCLTLLQYSGVADFCRGSWKNSATPPRPHLLVGLKINLGFASFYFQKSAL